MKFKKYNPKGFTLIEVLLGLALLSVVLIIFSMGFTNFFINLDKGKNITVETFSMQELMENEIANFKIEDLGDNDKLVFGRKVKYKKIIKSTKSGKRNLVAYISTPKLGVLPTPSIEDVKLVAKNGDKEKFPWYEKGTKLVASYDDSDSDIFELNYAWYASQEKYSDNSLITNPEFSKDYDIIKYGNGIAKLYMFSSHKTLEFEDLKNKSYYYYGITPYSEFGKLGRMAFNDKRRLLVIKRTPNEYWNKLIEDSYLEKVATNLNPYILTMNNINEPTLNIESDESTKDNNCLLFYKLPFELEKKNNQLTTIVETKFTEKVLEIETKEAGFGLFLGEYDDIENTEKNGIIFLISPKKNLINIIEIINGDRKDENLMSFEIQEEENFWEKRHTWKFEIIRKNEKENIEISYKAYEDKDKETKDSQEFKSLGSTTDYSTNYKINNIGLKTWSDYDFQDNSTKEHNYTHNLTVDFYDIEMNFEGLDEDDYWDDKNWTDGGSKGFYSGNSHNIEGETETKLNIKMNRDNSQLQGNLKKILRAKALWFTENTNLTIGNNDTLKIKVEELVIFDSTINFGNKNNDGKSSVDISGIDNNSYPIKVYFKENQKVRIKDKLMNISKENYIKLNSGNMVLTGGEDDTINITGDCSIE